MMVRYVRCQQLRAHLFFACKGHDEALTQDCPHLAPSVASISGGASFRFIWQMRRIYTLYFLLPSHRYYFFKSPTTCCCETMQNSSRLLASKVQDSTMYCTNKIRAYSLDDYLGVFHQGLTDIESHWPWIARKYMRATCTPKASVGNLSTPGAGIGRVSAVLQLAN